LFARQTSESGYLSRSADMRVRALPFCFYGLTHLIEKLAALD